LRREEEKFTLCRSKLGGLRYFLVVSRLHLTPQAGSARPALAVTAWAFLFAIPSFYWAAGGSIGEDTIAADVEEALGALGEPWFVALTGVAKVMAGLLPLALILVPLDHAPRRVLGLLIALIGAGMIVYAAANFLQHGLMLLNAIDTPDSLGRSALHWHFFFWDPWWLLGGALFVVAARSAQSVEPGRAWN
jgi:Protein of unknown function (DUF3995)